MKITISLVGDSYDLVMGPYEYLSSLAKKTKLHQRGWKKVPSPGLLSLQTEPKEMVTFWKWIEIFLVIASYLYIQFIIVVFTVINYFKRLLF